MPTNRREELLEILAEECAEVIQAKSKQIRFGVNAFNQLALETELGDVAGVMKLLIVEGYINPDKIQVLAEEKIAKLANNMTFKALP
jgi:NTP pyrophosphatase (non-canonical NTP hydrolase)